MEDFTELYYRRPYVHEFDATVLSCTPSDDGFEVELDQTAFYPEGGGQPGDRGTLSFAAGNGEAAVRVLDTRKRGDATIHLTSAELQVGERVHGEINWTLRSDNMQAHTGEHILSGLVHARFGYDNVGFHMGEECIEVDFNGPIDEAQALEIEQRANEAVRADLEVRELFPSSEELATMNYRSKKELEGIVRIVEIPGVDMCACCGTHVETTGQVGLIKILSVASKKKGTRIELLCGRRALLAYEDEMAQVHGISTLLSAKMGEVLDAVQRLDQEKADLRHQLQQANRRCIDLEVAALPEEGGLVVRFEEGMGTDELRYFCNKAMETGRAKTVAALAQDASDPSRINYVMASSAIDLRAAVKDLNAKLGGRGGGKPEMVQGSFSASREEIEATLHEGLVE